MPELMSSIQLNEFLHKNNISDCSFIGFVCHKSDSSVYGSLFNTEKGMVFQRHKWTRVNKDKKPPKVCAEIKYTHKLVDDDFWSSFKPIDRVDYINIDSYQMIIA